MSDFKVSFGFARGSNPPEPQTPSEPSRPSHDGTIEFLCEPELLGTIPVPEKAIRFAPDWFKKLPREMSMKDAQGLPGLTVKACLPVTDVFALGYMLTLPYDVHLLVPEDRISIQMGWQPDVAFAPIEQHHPGQIGAPEAPFESTMPLKFINPWRIKVPDGYSVLFTQPFSRPDLPFTCFSGLVDCDRFDTTINIPFVWSGPTGEFYLPAGTPIAQILPIKRDTLLKDSISRASTLDEQAEQDNASRRKYNEESTYSREWRVKK